MIRRRRRHHAAGIAAALATILTVTGCSSLTPTERHACIDPDRKLAAVLRDPDRTMASAFASSQLCPIGAGRDCHRLRKEVERLTLVCPRHVPIMMAAALLAYEAGELTFAQRQLDEMQLITRYPPATILRARIALREGNVRYARRILDEEIKLVPDDGLLRETLAGVLYLEGRWTEARVALEAAASLGTPVWRVAYNFGLLEEASGHFEAAAQRYTEALQARPEWPLALSRLQGLRVRKGPAPR